MFPKKVYIDASLLVLLVVGRTGKDLIAKHRRLQRFQIDDYERLARLLNQIDQVLVTPNILTEASNLLAQHGEPERSSIFHMLRALVEKTEEVFVVSKVATDNSEFIRLGLTDAALLEVVSRSNPLITADLDLYLAASAIESEAAFNFWHHQPL